MLAMAGRIAVMRPAGSIAFASPKSVVGQFDLLCSSDGTCVAGAGKSGKSIIRRTAQVGMVISPHPCALTPASAMFVMCGTTTLQASVSCNNQPTERQTNGAARPPSRLCQDDEQPS